MKSKAFVLVMVLALTISCSDDDLIISEVSGTIVDASTIAGLEDCGFLVRIDGTLYQPTYLNFQYEQDGLEVLMKVEFLEEISDCSLLLSSPPTRLRIEQIRPSN